MEQTVAQFDQDIDQLLGDCVTDGLLNEQFAYLMQLQVHHLYSSSQITYVCQSSATLTLDISICPGKRV